MEASLTTASFESAPAFSRSRWWPWIGSAPFVLWPAYVLSRGEVRWEMVTLMVLVPALAFTSVRTRMLFTGLFPLGLVAFLYDTMRFVKNAGLTPASVHVCDLRALESHLFGYSIDGREATLHTYFRAHPSPVLDALCAVPYGTYIYVVIAAAVLLYPRDYRMLQRFTWTFFVLNIAGFITYHLYPAAPPWYFHAHGCNVDLAARASEGAALARVDARMGFGYFRGFYGRSNDVFGAVPSLHVSYPVLVVLATWPFTHAPLRTLTVGYAALMCLAAVYLDHHWVIDVLVGLLYTALAWTLVSSFFRARDATP